LALRAGRNRAAVLGLGLGQAQQPFGKNPAQSRRIGAALLAGAADLKRTLNAARPECGLRRPSAPRD
jgi:hypothetical protein